MKRIKSSYLIAEKIEKIAKMLLYSYLLKQRHAIHVEELEKFGTIVSDFLLKHKRRSLALTVEWIAVRKYEDILYETYNGIAKITINRPQVHNAFTPKTVLELIDAFAYARDDKNVGVIVLTGAGEKAFCSGGDQKCTRTWRLCWRRQYSTLKCS